MEPPPRLAIYGAPPTFPSGPPIWPAANEAVRAALIEVYESGDWGRYHGSHCRQLQESMSAMLGVPYVQLCCSGTFAVELALRSLAIGPGDEVILAGYDFPGNFRAIEDCGAFPVLADLAPGTWSIDPAAVAEAITPRTRAMVVSHLHGSLADMPRLRQLADRHGIAIVEDACQVPGATVAGRPAGTWGDVGTWSFGGSKLLSAGRGGAIFTSRPECAQRAKVFCERGNDAFPMSELQAAVLPPQLAALADDNVRRASAVTVIVELLSTQDLLQTAENGPSAADVRHDSAYYKLGLWYNLSQKCDISLDRYIAAVQAEGVAIDRGFRGFVRRPASRCRKIGSLPEASRAAADTLVLHHPVLLAGTETAEEVAKCLLKVAHELRMENE